MDPLIHFLGSGTPLGQRGLHQAAILVETTQHRLLSDCGMTVLTSLGRIGMDPRAIDAVLIFASARRPLRRTSASATGRHASTSHATACDRRARGDALAQHNPATAPTGLRLVIEGVTIGYSGDAGWSEALIDIAHGADLFICGVWSFDTPDDTFIDLTTLRHKLTRLDCRRVVLTHLGPDVLDRLSDVPIEAVTDGSTIKL